MIKFFIKNLCLCMKNITNVLALLLLVASCKSIKENTLNPMVDKEVGLRKNDVFPNKDLKKSELDFIDLSKPQIMDVFNTSSING